MAKYETKLIIPYYSGDGNEHGCLTIFGRDATEGDDKIEKMHINAGKAHCSNELRVTYPLSRKIDESSRERSVNVVKEMLERWDAPMLASKIDHIRLDTKDAGYVHGNSCELGLSLLLLSILVSPKVKYFAATGAFSAEHKRQKGYELPIEAVGYLAGKLKTISDQCINTRSDEKNVEAVFIPVDHFIKYDKNNSEESILKSNLYDAKKAFNDRHIMVYECPTFEKAASFIGIDKDRVRQEEEHIKNKGEEIIIDPQNQGANEAKNKKRSSNGYTQPPVQPKSNKILWIAVPCVTLLSCVAWYFLYDVNKYKIPDPIKLDECKNIESVNNPEDAETVRKCGYSDKYNDAIKALEKSLDNLDITNDKEANARLNLSLGILYKHIGKYEKSKEYINEVFTIYPENTNTNTNTNKLLMIAELNRGDLNAIQKKPDAKQHYTNVTTHYKGSEIIKEKANLKLGCWNLKQINTGDLKDARSNLENVYKNILSLPINEIESNKDIEFILAYIDYKLSVLYNGINNKDDAQKLFELSKKHMTNLSYKRFVNSNLVLNMKKAIDKIDKINKVEKATIHNIDDICFEFD